MTLSFSTWLALSEFEIGVSAGVSAIVSANTHIWETKIIIMIVIKIKPRKPYELMMKVLTWEMHLQTALRHPIIYKAGLEAELEGVHSYEELNYGL